jgi:hypothetical protein
MSRLSETNPELFENKTLGAATTSPFLDQLEEQKKEDFNARLAGREPRTVVAEDRYPQFMPSGSVPSNIQPKLSYLGESNEEEEVTTFDSNTVEVDNNEVTDPLDPEEENDSDLPPEIQALISNDSDEETK